MPDDATLLRRFVDTRAEDAFAALVHRHLDAVYSAALRRVGGDRHLAEDVAQQVFADLARRAARLLHHPALSAWLHLATRHAAANAVRTERRRRAREQAALAMPDTSPPSAPDWSRLAPLIDAAIDRLNDRDRTAIILRFVENRSFADIGAALQLSDDAARMRVTRALDQLRTHLARRGIASTSTALGLALSHHAVLAAPAPLAASTAHAALLSAAAPASTATALLAAMTSTKTAALVAGAALLGALGSATFEDYRERTAAAALSAAEMETSALAGRLRSTEAAAATAEREAAALDRQLRERLAAQNQSATAAARAAIAPAASVTPRDPIAEGRAFMDRHPAVRQALIDMYDAETDFTWSRFYQAAGLSPAQIAEFRRLQRPPAGAAFTRQMNPGQPDLVLSFDNTLSVQEADAARRALLGPDGYAKCIDYIKGIPVRELGAQLAGALAFTPEPLTAGQFDQFTQKLVANGAATMTASGPHYDWTRVSAGAENLLLPAQRNALAALQAQADYQREYSRAAATLRMQPSTAATSSKP